MTTKQYQGFLLELILKQLAHEKGLFINFCQNQKGEREMQIHNPKHHAIPFLHFIVTPCITIKVPICKLDYPPLISGKLPNP